MKANKTKNNDNPNSGLLTEKWVLGYRDRGHGHGDFSVITETGILVVECSGRELAEHIIKLHNVR